VRTLFSSHRFFSFLLMLFALFSFSSSLSHLLTVPTYSYLYFSFILLSFYLSFFLSFFRYLFIDLLIRLFIYLLIDLFVCLIIHLLIYFLLLRCLFSVVMSSTYISNTIIQMSTVCHDRMTLILVCLIAYLRSNIRHVNSL
jgi:hypothetical protein